MIQNKGKQGTFELKCTEAGQPGLASTCQLVAHKGCSFYCEHSQSLGLDDAAAVVVVVVVVMMTPADMKVFWHLEIQHFASSTIGNKLWENQETDIFLLLRGGDAGSG